MTSKIAFVEEASKPNANISALCRKYEISRQTGHKWLKRFLELGYDGLEDQSRRPKSSPVTTSEDIIAALLKLRVDQPRWGPKKLVIVLRREFGEATPSERTVHRVLRRFGHVRQRRRKRGLSVVERAPEVEAKACNDVWTIDFKGWWKAMDGTRCEPLTVRDAYSRYVLALVLTPTTIDAVKRILTRLFDRYGVPKAIQCDNGTPFICMTSVAGLTQLSAWWVSLGIRVVRSRPGCPQDNGGHERMHADLAREVEAFPAESSTIQQRACDRWRKTFNEVRPHEALGGKAPAEVYSASSVRPRARKAIYPSSWTQRCVSRCGQIKLHQDHYYVSRALAGYVLGLEPIDALHCRVWFFDIRLLELEVAHLAKVA